MFSRLFSQYEKTAPTVAGLSTLYQLTDYYKQRKNLSIDFYLHPGIRGYHPFRKMEPFQLWEHVLNGSVNGYLWPITLAGHLTWKVTGGRIETFYFENRQGFDGIISARTIQSVFAPGLHSSASTETVNLNIQHSCQLTKSENPHQGLTINPA